MSPELIDAIKERIKKGFSRETIHEEMRSAGYDDETINSVYEKVKDETNAEVSSIPEDNNKTDEAKIGLPSFVFLVKESFSYTLKRKDLIGWNMLLMLAVPLAIPLVLFSFTTNIGFGFVLMFVSMIAFIVVSVMVGLAMHYIIVKDSIDYSVSFKEGWNWARKNLFWSGLWILVLFSLITQGAINLFFIPYIVIGPFLSFMIYAYTNENFKGFSAIFRARELGKGNWQGLLIRKVLFWLLILVPIIIIIGVSVSLVLNKFSTPFNLDGGFDDVFYTMLPMIITLGFVLFIYGIFAAIWSIRFNVLLFKHLSAARPVNEESGKGTDKWKYILLIIAGLLLSGSSNEPNMFNSKYKNDDYDAKQRATEMRVEDEFQEFFKKMEELGVDTTEVTEEMAQ